jgi:phosphatidylserine decarboxylase
MMHFAPEGYPRIFGLGIATLVLNLLGWWWLGLFFLILTLFAVFFFRDPDRPAPRGEQLVLAPADGRIVTIEKNVQEPRFLAASATRVGIFMSPLDVHVNRMPVTGTVEAVRYQPGQFKPAFAAEAAEVNEQNAVVLETPKGKRFALVQVAGIMARRIVCGLRGGENVQQGERYGMIMFGSRVDLYCPPETELRVHVGQKVKAGETIIGNLPE